MTLGRTLTPLVPALVIVGFFLWFSNWIPQTRWEPPRRHAVGETMAPAELARVGTILVRERGCLTCHTIEPGVGVKGQGRGPNLANIAARRADGAPGRPQSLVVYLAESLYEPGAYLVEGYANIMPPAQKPPSKLTHGEVSAVVAYLQSLGGQPSVRVGDVPRPAAALGAAAQPAAAGVEGVALLEKHDCLACHSLKRAEVLAGPALDAETIREGAKERSLSPEGYVLESVVLPRAFKRGDFPPDLMPDDYGTRLTAAELQNIVAYLLSGKAKP